MSIYKSEMIAALILHEIVRGGLGLSSPHGGGAGSWVVTRFCGTGLYVGCYRNGTVWSVSVILQ